jgi:hypothetical protein
MLNWRNLLQVPIWHPRKLDSFVTILLYEDT